MFTPTCSDPFVQALQIYSYSKRRNTSAFLPVNKPVLRLHSRFSIYILSTLSISVSFLALPAINVNGKGNVLQRAEQLHYFCFELVWTTLLEPLAATHTQERERERNRKRNRKRVRQRERQRPGGHSESGIQRAEQHIRYTYFVWDVRITLMCYT